MKKLCIFTLAASLLFSTGAVAFADDSNRNEPSSTATSESVAKLGWFKESGDWFYRYADGSLAKNKWIGNYYLGEFGKMLVSTWTPDGYYVGASGEWDSTKAQYKLGWFKESGDWFYRNTDGTLAKNRWQGNYYLGEFGKMLVSTWTPDGYYVDANGKWVEGKTKNPVNRWVKNSLGQWLYQYKNGTYAANTWIGNYYLGSNGIMLTSTWTPDGYYVDANGKWVEGAVKETPKSKWIQDSRGNWYYKYSNGTYAVNTWVGNYYLGSNGVMLTDTWTPDGYYVDANGKWVEGLRSI